MPDLKERFQALDEARVPDLHRAIQARVSSLQRPDHQVTAAEEAWQQYERRPRMTTRLTQALAAATILALGIGVAAIFHYARTGAPAHPKPTPSLVPGVVTWVNRPAAAYSPPPQPSPTPYPTSAARCLASQLRVAAGQGFGGGGNSLEPFTFTNVSDTTCLLSGRPRVTGINATGRRVDLPLNPGQTYFGPLVPADLAPGAEGYLYFWTSPNCPQPAPETVYRSLSFKLPSGGTLTSGLSVSANSCGLRMDDLGLPLPVVPPSPTLSPGGLTSLAARVDLPQSARVGQTLHYTVTLRNPTDVPVSLSPCPSYIEALDPSMPPLYFYLNCDQVTVIPPHGQVVYAMEMRIPSNAVTGNSSLMWQFFDSAGPAAGAGLTVLPAS